MRFHKFIGRPVILLVLLAFTGACKTNQINPNDDTPPVVEILVNTGNEYEFVDGAVFSDEAIEVMCRVTDPDGVKWIKLSFSGKSNNCTLPNGNGYTGTFILLLPAPLEQTLQGTSSGDVITVLPMFADLERPQCKINSGATGYASDLEITAHCEGQNWSANDQVDSAFTNLTITD